MFLLFSEIDFGLKIVECDLLRRVIEDTQTIAFNLKDFFFKRQKISFFHEKYIEKKCFQLNI